MKKMGHLILIMMFLSSCLLVFKPTNALACSCAGPSSVEEALKDRTAIFSGKVIKITDPKKGASVVSSDDPISVLFEVKSSWKGVKANQVIVTTARDSATCGLDFTVGNEYLVYAYGKADQLQTGLCERTKPLLSASADLQILGVGKAPTEKVNLELSGNSNVVWWGIGGAIVMVLASGLIVIYRSRMKNK